MKNAAAMDVWVQVSDTANNYYGYKSHMRFQLGKELRNQKLGYWNVWVMLALPVVTLAWYVAFFQKGGLNVSTSS
jgi:hypothetical protein